MADERQYDASNVEYAKAFDEAETRARDVLEGKASANEFCEWVICANANICVGKRLDENNCWSCRMGKERDVERLRSLYWEARYRSLLVFAGLAEPIGDFATAKERMEKYGDALLTIGADTPSDAEEADAEMDITKRRLKKDVLYRLPRPRRPVPVCRIRHSEAYPSAR